MPYEQHFRETHQSRRASFKDMPALIDGFQICAAKKGTACKYGLSTCLYNAVPSGFFFFHHLIK
jgi:hypothetical protein